MVEVKNCIRCGDVVVEVKKSPTDRKEFPQELTMSSSHRDARECDSSGGSGGEEERDVHSQEPCRVGSCTESDSSTSRGSAGTGCDRSATGEDGRGVANDARDEAGDEWGMRQARVMCGFERQCVEEG